MVEDYQRADVILANVGKYSTATGMQQQHQSGSNDHRTDEGRLYTQTQHEAFVCNNTMNHFIKLFKVDSILKR